MAVRTASLEMRRGRQIALDSRRKCRVIFTAPRTVRIESQAPASQGGGWSQLSEVELPGDIEFRIESAVGWGPESYPTSQAINFGTSGYSEVYFMPDGSAIGADGQNCNGVVYMCRAGDVETVRAVTLFGSTGRLKRWEWAYDGSSWDWEQ